MFLLASAQVRHKALNLRTMSHMTTRPTKRLCNHATFVVRHESPAQDSPRQVASGLCTGYLHTFNCMPSSPNMS